MVGPFIFTAVVAAGLGGATVIVVVHYRLGYGALWGPDNREQSKMRVIILHLIKLHGSLTGQQIQDLTGFNGRFLAKLLNGMDHNWISSADTSPPTAARSSEPTPVPVAERRYKLLPGGEKRLQDQGLLNLPPVSPTT